MGSVYMRWSHVLVGNQLFCCDIPSPASCTSCVPMMQSLARARVDIALLRSRNEQCYREIFHGSDTTETKYVLK